MGKFCYTPFAKVYLFIIKKHEGFYVTIVEAKLCRICEECGETEASCDSEWSFYKETGGRLKSNYWPEYEYIDTIQVSDSEICLPLPPYTLK